jgi:hypothetical protein
MADTQENHMKMNKRIVPVFLSLFVSLFLIAGQVYGQGTTSRVTGTVGDATGAVVPGATVILTNEANNVSFTTETSSGGAYAFDLIPAGVYKVSVEKSGFKKFVSTGNVVQINQPATVNITMEVGDVAALVTVQATAEVVQTGSSGNIGSTIDQRTLESLPIVGLRGRNPLELTFNRASSMVGTQAAL